MIHRKGENQSVKTVFEEAHKHMNMCKELRKLCLKKFKESMTMMSCE